MFRVTVDLNALIQARRNSARAEGPQVSAQKDRRGDWVHEFSYEHPHLTREEVCETFADKVWCKEAIKRSDNVA